MYLANFGNYRETRWFKAWPNNNIIEEFILPKEIQDITNQIKVPFGFGIINMGEAHSESSSHFDTPSFSNLCTSLLRVLLCTAGTGKALPWKGYTFP